MPHQPLSVCLCVFFLAGDPMMPQNGGCASVGPARPTHTHTQKDGHKHTHTLLGYNVASVQPVLPLPNVNPISSVHLAVPRLPGLGPRWKLPITVTLSYCPSVCLSGLHRLGSAPHLSTLLFVSLPVLVEEPGCESTRMPA